MEKPSVVGKILRNRRGALISRLLLGLTLLVFGASKVLDLTYFTQIVLSYGILPEPLAKTYGFALPWVEVFVGACLIFGLWLRLVAPFAALIVVSFIIGTSASLYVLQTEVNTCGCLIGVDWPLNWAHLVAQVLLLLMSIHVSLHIFRHR